jgi:hypothetical protein
MSIRRAGSDLYVETIYTADRREDLPCGGWACIPDEPEGVGWFLWDTNPDRKSGWIRVWARRGGIHVHAEGGCA